MKNLVLGVLGTDFINLQLELSRMLKLVVRIRTVVFSWESSQTEEEEVQTPCSASRGHSLGDVPGGKSNVSLYSWHCLLLGDTSINLSGPDSSWEEWEQWLWRGACSIPGEVLTTFCGVVGGVWGAGQDRDLPF